MNPNAVSGNNNTNSLFVNSFETKIEKDNSEPVELVEVDVDTVTYTDEHKAAIKNSWAEFYALKTEDVIGKITPERPAERFELQQTRIETQFQEPVKYYEKEEVEIIDTRPSHIIDQQKGSGNWLEDAGFQLNFKGLFKVLGSFGKSLLGAMNIFKEIAFDTGKVLQTGFKKDKPVKKEDPAKAKKEADKKRKFANIRAFYDGLRAQSGSVVSKEAVQAETQERENINKTIKLTNASYKGIKDATGRLTVYAANMFEREQLEQEKVYKKIEKQQKMASTKGPDLNLDKAAEGGFLSSTGGQGAG